uniref:Large ribosomal subunit protein uL23c n=1 Tax=Cycas shiwandashanica TaxID=2004578 RepID=A0A7M3UTJ4_9SPER|nr:ribosomal protein L23 [Cycas shiwandashanica]QOJ45252.1 ribosomal protein L23 [Cycas shiwandashanica]
MNKMEYTILTEKKIRLLENNQYTFDVGSRPTKTGVKNWIELFFGVKVIAMNSYRPPKKGGTVGPIGHPIRCRRMIIALQPGYSIPLLSEE